jgi:hypothetical protein
MAQSELRLPALVLHCFCYYHSACSSSGQVFLGQRSLQGLMFLLLFLKLWELVGAQMVDHLQAKREHAEKQ